MNLSQSPAATTRNRISFGCAFRKLPLAILFASLQAAAVAGAAWNPGPDWESEVTTTPPGAIPAPKPVVLRYSFGWSGIEAGRAKVNFSTTRNGYAVSAEGGTVGMARSLWVFDVAHRAKSKGDTFEPIGFEQTETLKTKKNQYSAIFNAKGVEATKTERVDGKPKKSERRFRFPGTLDLFSAYLYLRTFPWSPGDEATIALFPAFTPYLIHLEALGAERISVPAGEYDAIKIRLDIRKIGKKKSLAGFKKFKRATMWISNDDDRYVLKVDTDLFIGTVYAQLVGVEK